MSVPEVDTHTELPVISIPPEYYEKFKDLSRTTIHYFHSVAKISRDDSKLPRILVITDKMIFLCLTTGSITRSIRVKSITELVSSSSTGTLTLKVPHPDYDLVIVLSSQLEMDKAIHIISRIYWEETGGIELQHREAFTYNTELLKKMAEIEEKGQKDQALRLEQDKVRRGLAKVIQEREKQAHEDRVIVSQEIMKMKQALRAELEDPSWNRGFDQLVERVQILQDQLAAKDQEILLWKNKQMDLFDERTWRLCPNCIAYRRGLATSPEEMKVKILQLTLAVKGRSETITYLQKGMDKKRQTLSDLLTLQKKSDELREIIVDIEQLIKISNKHIPLDYKERMNDVLQRVPAKDRSIPLATTPSTAEVAKETIHALEAKDKEIAYLRGILAEGQQRHVQQLQYIRSLFYEYDDKLVGYMEKVMSEGNRGMTLSPNQRQMQARETYDPRELFDSL